MYEWEFTIFGPPDTLYEGGFFRATMSFPQDFPLNPPKMKFLTEMWHPNSEAPLRSHLSHFALDSPAPPPRRPQHQQSTADPRRSLPSERRGLHLDLGTSPAPARRARRGAPWER